VYTEQQKTSSGVYNVMMHDDNTQKKKANARRILFAYGLRKTTPMKAAHAVPSGRLLLLLDSIRTRSRFFLSSSVVCSNRKGRQAGFRYQNERK
jgi:hypothetical protein